MVGRTTPKAVPAGRIPICRPEYTRLKADILSLTIGSLTIGSLRWHLDIPTGFRSSGSQFHNAG